MRIGAVHTLDLTHNYLTYYQFFYYAQEYIHRIDIYTFDTEEANTQATVKYA